MPNFRETILFPQLFWGLRFNVACGLKNLASRSCLKELPLQPEKKSPSSLQKQSLSTTPFEICLGYGFGWSFKGNLHGSEQRSL